MGFAELNVTLRFQVTHCCHKGCGAPIAMPSDTMDYFVQKREIFYCCWGHSQRFTGKTEAEKLKEQLEAEKRTSEWNKARAARLDRQLSAAKGQVTKIKNRVGNGV